LANSGGLSYMHHGENMKTPEIVFTGGTDTGTITCKQCGKTKTIDISQFKNIRKHVKVKCACGFIFDILFESRKYYRKKVWLKGKLLKSQSNNPIDEITITDVSMGGVRFLTNLKDINYGEVYKIEFILDDEYRSYVKEEIVIKYIKNREIGAEFAESEKYNYDLDFYLTPFSIVE
jgi:hypothetical protein